MSANRCTVFNQLGDNGNGRSVPHVVCFGLECEAKDSDSFSALMSAKRLADFSSHARLLGGINFDYRLDNSESHPIFLGYPEQCLGVFWKAGTAIAGSGVKKFFPYPAVKTHAPGYVLDVAADFLAKVGDLV